MNELSQPMQTPIEIALGVDADNTTTAKRLYAFLELDSRNYSRWCKSNIIENPYATENVDFWAFVTDEERDFNPNPTTDYRLTATFAKKLSMASKAPKGEIAREYFTRIEDKMKRAVIDRESLSPTLQMVYAIADNNATLELRQKQLEKRQDDQDAKVAYFGEKISNMKEIFLQPVGDWKEDINKRVREIAIKAYSGDYQKVFTEMYAQLEIEANTNLSRRCENKRIRMEKAGNTKDTIKKATTKLAIIYDDKKLRAIFELIVKKWAMSYCA